MKALINWSQSQNSHTKKISILKTCRSFSEVNQEKMHYLISKKLLWNLAARSLLGLFFIFSSMLATKYSHTKRITQPIGRNSISITKHILFSRKRPACSEEYGGGVMSWMGQRKLLAAVRAVLGHGRGAVIPWRCP
jgi:hypothetical protein